MPTWPGIKPEAQQAVVDLISARHFLDWEFDVFELQVRDSTLPPPRPVPRVRGIRLPSRARKTLGCGLRRLLRPRDRQTSAPEMLLQRRRPAAVLPSGGCLAVRVEATPEESRKV